MSDKCVMCEKTVYCMEKVEALGKIFHKTCFRCSHCKGQLRMDTFTSNRKPFLSLDQYISNFSDKLVNILDGQLFCIPHFKQLFKVKGNYDEGFGKETQKQIFERKLAAGGGPTPSE